MIHCVQQAELREEPLENCIVFLSELNCSHSRAIPGLNAEDLSANTLGPDRLPTVADSP